MASLSDITISQNEYRPCYVKGRKALFHRWYENASIKQEILNNEFGQHVRFMFGIVEYENGQVEVVAPNEIRFCDKKIEGYYFNEREE